MRTDDLGPLFAGEPASAVGFRQGRIIAWNPLTAQNTVDVGGTSLTDVPVLNTSEALLLRPGDVVALLTTGQGAQSWWIAGRVTIPGTPQAASALSMLGVVAATVATVEATTSTTFTDLATVGPVVPNVLIGNSGRCLVFLTSLIQENSANQARGGTMAFAISGATTRAASFNDSLRAQHTDDGVISAGFSSNNLSAQFTAACIVTGLTAGLNTFTAKYLSGDGSTVQFGSRTLIVFPL